MKKYKVTFSIDYLVNADSGNDALDEAEDMLVKDFESNYCGLAEMFNSEVVEIEKNKSNISSYEEAIRSLKDKIIEDIKSEVGNEHIMVSIITGNPYDCSEPPINIYEVRKNGVLTAEYEGIIEFFQLNVEDLVMILSEILKSKQRRN